MNNKELQYLLQEYFNNTISRVDCVKLLQYLSEVNPDEITGVIDKLSINLNDGPEFNATDSKDAFQRIITDPRFLATQTTQKPQGSLVFHFYKKKWLQIAAVLLICCTAAFYTYKAKLNKEQQTAHKTTPVIIVPGGKKAMLTLGNGKVIVLDHAKDGLVAEAGNSSIHKSHNNELVYSNTITGEDTPSNKEPATNTLTTPRGGEYQLKLADGTKVWLNSASSITYPAEFNGKERRVELTGEAYFEVAKNNNKPFLITTNKVEIKVLGTHFNISAFSDDAKITTTLLEGSVQISKNSNRIILKPGEQAIINNGLNDIIVSQADVEEAMAWKNGYFIFNNDDITSIMKKISRWYDVEVEYKGNFKNQRFGGTFYRSKGIKELLRYLGKIGNVQFKIVGRRVTVIE